MYKDSKEALQVLIDNPDVNYTGKRVNIGKYLNKEFVIEENRISSVISLPRDGDIVFDFDVSCYIVDKSGKSEKVEKIEPEVSLKVGGLCYEFDSVDEFRKTFTETNFISLTSLTYHEVAVKVSFDVSKLSFDKDVLSFISMTNGFARQKIRQDFAENGYITKVPKGELDCKGGVGGFHYL